MRMIINGKKYDTDTASWCGNHSNLGQVGKSNFRWVDEDLYQKMTGEFFLAGSGGAMTRYAEPCGTNGKCSGWGIFPLKEHEAKEWAEKYLKYDEYVEIFGEPEE